jgi:ribA/ribD-fused uncharacterized protein
MQEGDEPMNIQLNNNPTTTKEVAAMSTPTTTNTIIKWHDEDVFWQCSVEEYRQIYTEGIRFAVCEKMGDIYKLESNGNLHAYVYSGELLAQLIKNYHNESEEENMKSQPNPQPKEQVMKPQPQPKEKVMKVSDMPQLDGKFVIAGTGSRSLVNDEDKMNKVEEYLIDLLTQAKAKHGDNLVVISGMAEGFDEVLARAAMCVGVTLIAAIPNKGYSAYYWRNNSVLKIDRMDTFQELARYANNTGAVHYVCGKNIYVDGKHSNFVRNEWMADRADVVWVYNPTSRGTAQCYNYCRTNGIKTFIINPEGGNMKNTEGPVEPMNPTEKDKDMKAVPMFKQDEYKFLSNMYPVDIVGYKCVESFYMAMKTENKSIREQIKSMNGFEAKKFARTFAIRKDWNEIKMDVMRHALVIKFEPGTELAAKLLATGDVELIETNTWHDNFWGQCICGTVCNDVTGKNMLGAMLMEIRDSLKDNGGESGKDMPKTPNNPQQMKEEKPMNTIIEQTKKEVAMYVPGNTQTFFHGIVDYMDIWQEVMEVTTVDGISDKVWSKIKGIKSREDHKNTPAEEKNVCTLMLDKLCAKYGITREYIQRRTAAYESGYSDPMIDGGMKVIGGNMRLITTMPLTGMDASVKEEFKQGAYSFAFLDTFFPQGYRVEVRNIKHSLITAAPLPEDEITPDTVIRWSTADHQFTIIVNNNNGWLDAFNKIGLTIGNSKKFAKRSQEFARQSCMYGLYNNLDVEIMDPADLGVDEKYVDGISAVSRTIMVNMIENNQNASDEWKEAMIKRVESGKMSIVQLRVLTPQGLIKGNAIVLPDKMMNGYDIRTFTPNVKAEIKTDGWYWATAEGSYGKLPLSSDDLTLAIYRDVMGVIDPWLMLSTLQHAMNELVDNYKNGSDSDWRKEVAMNIDNEDDMNPNKNSMIKRIDQLADKLNEIGLGIESSQLLMYLKARGVAMMFGILTPEGKMVPEGDAATQRGVGTRMPVPFAYRAHIMTREVLEIFGYKFNNKGMQGFYHDKTHCFVVPGEFFVENYPNHGGPDLDDSINVMIRDFVNAEGKRSYKALLMRNPNDFGEWSAIPVAPSEVEHCYHTYGNVPTVIEAELRAKVEQLSNMLKNNRINYSFEELPGASTLEIGDVYSIEDEVRMRKSAAAMPGGTGATVLPKMLTYAITGKVITDQLVSNEQIIDAVQQGLGTPGDMKLISESGDEFYREIKRWMVSTGGRIDQYWIKSKRVPMRVGIEFKYWGKNFSFVADKENSPILEMMQVREAIVRAAYKELLEWANTPYMPACIANMAMDNEERKLAATEFAQITQWFYAVTADGTTKDWAKKLVETLEKSDKEKGEAYTDRKMLRLFRQGFIAKTAKPMGNHDKWLFVVDPELNALPIDWLIRAYQRFIIS